MKLYNIYVKKSKSEAIEDLLLIKDGFSFPVFFFNILWFLYHKMWRESIILLIVNSIIVQIAQETIFNGAQSYIIITAFSLIIAINANAWYCNHLKRKKYQFSGYVFGKNVQDAKLKFVDNLSKKSGSSSIFSDVIFNIKKNTKPSQQENYFTI